MSKAALDSHPSSKTGSDIFRLVDLVSLKSRVAKGGVGGGREEDMLWRHKKVSGNTVGLLNQSNF